MSTFECSISLKKQLEVLKEQCESLVYRLDEAIKERDTLKKAMEKYKNTEQWLNDMKNPLEPLKVSAALDSEIMKLNYRKEHNPKSISELDGTIIAALVYALNVKEQEDNS